MSHPRVVAAIAALALAHATCCATEAVVVRMDAKHAAFLQQHCDRCHGAASQEAGVRLDDLSFSLGDIKTAERWQKVLNVLNAGEMPPADEPKPDAAQKAELLADLSQALMTARRTLGDQGRHAVLRRLNRREYQRTIQEFLGVTVDGSGLPDDKVSDTFDTAGSSLFMSSDQLEQYLDVGRRVVAETLRRWGTTVDPPPMNTVRVEVETAARRDMTRVISGALPRYRQYSAWKAAGADPARAHEFGFSQPDEKVIRFEGGFYEYVGPYVAQYLAQPGADDGAWLTVFSPEWRTDHVAVSIPADAPPGKYVLRLRVAADDNAAPTRRFLEMGIPGSGDRVGTADLFSSRDAFPVKGSLSKPELLEIPVAMSASSPRTFVFREKRHPLTAHETERFNREKRRNGVGPPLALWIDWVEWQGPLPDVEGEQRWQRLFGRATPSGDDAFAPRRVIERFATTVCRGVSLPPAVVEKLVALAMEQRKAGCTESDALVEPLAAVLASPGFLYLSEPAVAGVREAQDLSDLELASRLSYLLWSGPPDEKLLEAVAMGGLQSPVRLQAEVERMIADPKSYAFAKDFSHQWLGIDRLDFFQFDANLHNGFDDATRAKAKEEVYRTFHTLLMENRDVRQLLRSDSVVIDDLLAVYYGLDIGPVRPSMHADGHRFRNVKLPAGSPRGGLLGMAAILAMGSNGTTTSPVERGAWVLRKLLDDPPPPAPPNVPQISRLEGKPLTVRERLRLHQEEPQCAQCHRRIDGIGFGLENFDAAGLWRAVDPYDVKQPARTYPIDASGTFFNGPSFRDYFELRDHIADREADFLRGFVKNLFAYALGRPVSIADTETIERLVTETRRDGGRLASLIQAIVTTSDFQSK